MASANSLNQGAENIADEDDLEEGDHVAVRAITKMLVVQHHGIVVMGKKTLKIINFGSESKKGGLAKDHLEEQSLTQFRGSADNHLCRITYGPGEALAPAEVVERAKRMLINPWDFGDYHYKNNNCEHFATFCKTGMKVSKQTELWGIIETLATTVKVKIAGKWKQ